MYLSTTELAQWEKRSNLNIYFIIDSTIKPKLEYESITFNVKKYLNNRKGIKFYIGVQNNWAYNIQKKITITLKCTIFDDEGAPLMRHKPVDKVINFYLHLAHSECKLYGVGEEVEGKKIEINEKIKNWLLTDVDLLSNTLADKVKLEINQLGISIGELPYTSFKVDYKRLRDFKKEHRGCYEISE
jgi:hypothetical protein